MDANKPSPEQLITLAECIKNSRVALAPLLVKLGANWRRRDHVVALYPERHSPLHPSTQLHESWLWFLQEVSLASAHDSIAVAEAPAAQPVIAGLFLPALLYVKLVSLFDTALEEYITANRTTLAGQYKGTLHGRLEYLNQCSALIYSQRLRNIKDQRNAIGHRPTSPANWQDHQISWPVLAATINDIETALKHLALVGPRPVYEPYAERHVEMQPPDRPSVYMTHTYRYGVKEQGNVVIEFSHAIDYDKLPGL